jgi:hypothetical protein
LNEVTKKCKEKCMQLQPRKGNPRGAVVMECKAFQQFTECKGDENAMECSREASEMEYVKAMDCWMKLRI